MSSPSSYAHWNQPWSPSSRGSTGLDDEDASESSSAFTGLASSEFESEDDEFHEEEFVGILALAELARETFATSARGEDLEDYIAYLRDALTVSPRDGQARADILHSLAHNLYLSVSHAYSPFIDSLERLDESIHLYRLALYHSPHGSEIWAKYATGLAIALRARYSRSGDPDDLHDPISLHLQSLSFRPPGHPDRFDTLTHLANCHFARFEYSRSDVDLESAIAYDGEAIDILPSNHDHSKRASALLALAADYGARFGVHGSQIDLQRSTSLYQEALLLATTAEDSLRIAQQLASLLFIHYRATHNVTTLDQAIEVCSRPLKSSQAIPITSRLPAVQLLADLCLTRYFEGSQEPHYLEGAIQYCEQILEYLPETSSLSDRLNAFMNLSYALVARFSLTKGTGDIDSAIRLCTQAVELCAQGHPSRSRSLRALARSFAIRYEHSHDGCDLQEAFGRYTEAVRDSYGFTRERIAYAEELIELILRHKGQSKLLLEVYTSLLDLLRHLVYFEQDPRLREEDIRTMDHVLSGSLQCALSLNDIEAVVELVEQRQQMLWCPRRHDDAIPPPLRQRLHSIACELHGSSRDHSSHSSLTTLNSRYRRANSDDTLSRHRNLVDEFQSLVQHLRQYPGLFDLLRPIRFSDMVFDSDHPIVILLAQSPCQAIICRSTGLSKITLGITAEEARKLACEFYGMQQDTDELMYQMSSERTWEAVVGPILDALEYMDRPPGLKPRIWWCPTGPFVYIPLHAVGRYQPGRQSAYTFDYVVSSYTCSISSLGTRDRKPIGYAQKTPLPTVGLPTLEMASSKDDLRLVQIPSPIGSDGLSFSFNYDIDNLSKDRRASFIHLTGPLPDDAFVTSPQTDSSHLSYTTFSSILPDLAPPYAAFAFLHAERPCSHPMTLASGLLCETMHTGFALLSGGFHSIISMLPGWHGGVYPVEIAMVIEQVCRDIEFMDTSDSSIVPYALDNAIRSLRNSGIPLSRLIPFIHIGL